MNVEQLRKAFDYYHTLDELVKVYVMAHHRGVDEESAIEWSVENDGEFDWIEYTYTECVGWNTSSRPFRDGYTECFAKVPVTHFIEWWEHRTFVEPHLKKLKEK